MAFTFRKIISNISYFTKTEEDGTIAVQDDVIAERKNLLAAIPSSENIEFDRVEADSTSKATSLINQHTRTYTNKTSFSDTDLLSTKIEKKKKCRKLKVDIKKANHSMSDSFIYTENVDVENTPKHKLLDCKSADMFRGFNFNQSFDLSDADSYEEDPEIEYVSDHSDTDVSITTFGDDKPIKMCRKVEEAPIPSATPESFGDVEVDKNDEDCANLLLNYQSKFEKMDLYLKNLLTEFQFHIEVSKVFNGKSAGSDVNIRSLNVQRGISPAWNMIMEEENCNVKTKLKTQLVAMRQTIDQFVSTHLQEQKPKGKVSYKKKIKYYDFPDLREAMISLFEDDLDPSTEECNCRCHSNDSGLITKTDTNQSITSSIGNFSLDATTLSAYSESLDQVISYNSFNDTSLFSTLLQRAAIERITFYIQVHNIQLKCESPNENTKICFHCQTCNITEYEENGLLKHILSPNHCEKIHFVYKTAYVKKCISAGKEIQPSTILNPMTMYRDDNKIVCFGDAMYACSLCFETLIVGESVLMAHCSADEHLDRIDQLAEMLE